MSTANCACLALIVLAVPLSAAEADKPRIFVTESGALQASAEGRAGDANGFVQVTGGTSRQNIEVMRVFLERCPQVAITSNREKADYVVRLDSEGVNPTTPFLKNNKVAVFDRNEDLIYSDSKRLLSNAVKVSCAALVEHARR